MNTPQESLITLRSGVQGWIKCEAFRPRDGRRRLLADWFPNLITTAGLNIIGTVSGYLIECRVGSGSATPNVLDTALDAQVATTASLHASVLSAEATPPYFGAVTNTYRFDAGVAEGNLSEVGIGETSAGVLFSRALILDGVGDPTTITVLADEVLDVTYQLRLYPPEDDVTGTINISGVDYDYTLRAANVTAASPWAISSSGEIGGGFNNVPVYDGAIGAVTSAPSGTQGGSSSCTNSAYGNNDLYRDFTAVYGLDEANIGGIRSALVTFGASQARFGAMQIEFDPVIPKDNTKVLTLGFRHTWARKTLP